MVALVHAGATPQLDLLVHVLIIELGFGSVSSVALSSL